MKSQSSNTSPSSKASQGFSILEMLVVLIIMAILATLFVVRTAGVSARARDVEREDDIGSIARQLEDVYSNKKLSTPTYPDTVQITSNTAVFAGTEPEILKSPGMSTSSLIASTNSIATTAGVGPSPTIDQYVYQPLTSLGTLCTSGLVCVKYNLYYHTETDNVIWQKKGLHQQ